MLSQKSKPSYGVIIMPDRITKRDYDTVVIGGGPAGIAAALKARKKGLETLVVETRDRLGGIPLQCIHPGFGIHYFKKDMTGPEFVYRFIDKLLSMDIDYTVKSYVNMAKYVSAMEKKLEIITPYGTEIVRTKTIIYAAGARERTRYEIGITGPNPAGIMTAGEAQTLMDMYGVMPGKRILIVGSGDVGLIMARRFVLEGAEVVGVVEILPYPSGLMRNVQQCLRDYGIPLLLSHMVISVKQCIGRVSSAVVVKVDENFKPIQGTEKEIECDTIVIAAGLKPRTKLLESLGAQIDPRTKGPVVNEYFETTVPGVFVAGNALIINDYVDYAVEQGELAALAAAKYVDEKGIRIKKPVKIVLGRNMRLIVPQMLTLTSDVLLYGRVARPEDNVWLSFKEIGLRIPQLRVLPSIMIRQKIRLDKLRSLETDTLTVEVVPRD